MTENQEVAENFLKVLSKRVDTSFQPRIVMPGDDLGGIVNAPADGVLKIGTGLMKKQETILAVQPGQLNYRIPSTYWVDVSRKRYTARQGDQVVGVIDDKGGDFYVVNIFSGNNCILNRLSFEGATKRNRPELKKGDVVYARVQTAGKDIDTEITCTSSSGVKKEWSSGETVYGHLPNGLIIHVNIAFARRLLRPDCAVLNSLGRYLSYELAVGMNGAVWFRSMGGALESIIIRNAILNSEALTDLQTEAMVDQLMKISNTLVKH